MCDARRHARPITARPTEDSPSEASGASDRRGQAGTGGVSAPLAPSVSRPSQSIDTGREATPENPTRAIARAILSTLPEVGAAFVLATVAAMARAIIDAAAMLRQGEREEEARAVLGEALEAFDAPHPSGLDTLARGHALTALWWSATPRDVCGELTGAFWRSEGARESCEDGAREALEDIEAIAAEARPAATARAKRALVEDVATEVCAEGISSEAVKAATCDLAARVAGSVEAMALALALGDLATDRGVRGLEGKSPFSETLGGVRTALALALRAVELGEAMEEDTARRGP